jgi:hypothetical protein
MSKSGKLADAVMAELPKVEEKQRAALMKIHSNVLKGEYDDFRSSSLAPKLELVAALQELGLSSLVARVKSGEFDDDMV